MMYDDICFNKGLYPLIAKYLASYQQVINVKH